MRGNPDDLDLARRHVAEAKVRIENQRELIRKLRRNGHPTDLAESLLASLTELLRQMQAHEAFLSQD